MPDRFSVADARAEIEQRRERELKNYRDCLEKGSPVEAAVYDHRASALSAALDVLGRVTPETPRMVLVNPGLVDTFDIGDSVMGDWSREKSSVTDEHGNKIGHIDQNDGATIHVWVELG